MPTHVAELYAGFATQMAIANAIGSNVFDILLGLGLPWLIRPFYYGESTPVRKSMSFAKHRDNTGARVPTRSSYDRLVKKTQTGG